jgi:hypothetical protein
MKVAARGASNSEFHRSNTDVQARDELGSVGAVAVTMGGVGLLMSTRGQRFDERVGGCFVDIILNKKYVARTVGAKDKPDAW